MKRTSTSIITLAFCFAVFASCSKDVKKPVSNNVVSNAVANKTGGSSTTTSTTQTTTQTQGGHSCGGYSSGAQCGNGY